MKGQHAQKNFGAVDAMAPTPLSLKTRGRSGGGTGGGGDEARILGYHMTPALQAIGHCPHCS